MLRSLRAPLIERVTSQCATRCYTAPRGGHRQLSMSKKRLAMEKKRYCSPGPSVPICIMIVLFAAYNIYATQMSKDDNRFLR